MKKDHTSIKVMKQIIAELTAAEDSGTSDAMNSFLDRINSDDVYRANFKCLNGQGCLGYTKQGNKIIGAHLNAKGRSFLFDLKMKRKNAIMNWSLNVGIAAISAILGAVLARVSELLF